MKNKKVIMSFSALMIIIFHLWINITKPNTNIYLIETYLRYIGYIGVDIFFFVSAYSLAKNEIDNYSNFIIKRFRKIYLKFIIFGVIAFFFNKWSFLKLLKIIFGIEFLTKGGGSFLWFIPAIMIIYILLPLYKKLDNKYKIITPIITIITYLILVITLSINKKTTLLIFINRIPIILLGYYFSKLKIFEKLQKNNLLYYCLALCLTIVGLFFNYYLYINHFYLSYFQDIFYVLSIPLIIGVILLLDKIKSNNLFNYLGSITLEVYAIQMIFGYYLTGKLVKIISNSFLTNIISIVIVILIASFFNLIFNQKNIKKLLS